MKTAAQDAFKLFVQPINDTEELGQLVGELSGIEQFLFKNKKGSISAKTNGQLTKQLTSLFEQAENRSLEPEGDRKQQQFLRELRSYLAALPVVKVTLAWQPSAGFIEKLNREISDEFGQKIILEVAVDRDILGGACFEYAGRVGDYSLEERAKEVLSKLIG